MTTESVFQPIAGATALADEAARPYDRRWLAVDDRDHWLDAGRAPGLAALEVSLRFGYLVIRAEGMLRLDVPLDVIEDDDSVERSARIGGRDVRVVDEGELASAWFSQWLGQPCRLVKVHPDAGPVNWPG
ncbi:MOSC N-terminal beta barrel domain-containing protein [Castellaniella denitrificans]|uniref:MOSC N-terminal beta barrel domain-containing protein n=1 Tax=Castellaniella denitrificans TaxID=56119 RepID=A0ABT4M6P5_9BURK|nr:MOSC N-terminal beta barrel domain-containing protein [Castellaniella denitrificans]MCZ4330991.1 MOSC N-terminal beta barrel domain-containing protein [Castellaniella denitrificans]